jgi:3-phenylpropionate/cinnamic acid dioxygenase small subunit
MSLALEDKLAIHELLSRAAYNLDERAGEPLAANFAEQGSFSLRIAGGDLVGPFEGRDGIMELMTGAWAEQTDVRRHVVSNIFFDGEEQGNPVVVSNLTLFATEGGEIQLLTAGVYRDVVTRSGDRWVILHRHLELDRPY